jgi:uncharacterized protein (DUF58 family)
MRPGVSLIISIFLILCVSVLAFFIHDVSSFWYILIAIVFAISILDAVLLINLQIPVFERFIKSELSLGQRVEVKIVCISEGSINPHWIRIFDQIPHYFEHENPVLILKADQQVREERSELIYHVRAVKRGRWIFSGFRVRYPSPLGFWMRFLFIPHSCTGRIFPDFKAVSRMAAKEIKGRTDLSGVKILQRRGQGMEFDCLRDYIIGDSPRFIDWKASSRRTKLIVKSFREEQDQQVIFVLDTGYRLHRKEGPFLHFDKALNSLLLLSYVSLKHHDSVGVFAFGNQDRWVPPGKGLSRMPILINALYDVESANVASSPAAALERVLGLVRRRSLIILITNIRSEDRGILDLLVPTIPKRHLFLIVSLQEESAHDISKSDPESYEETLMYAAANKYLDEQRLLRLDWERKGVMVMETRPSKLGPDLINKYLELKGQGLF